MNFIEIELKLADIFTKPLSTKRIEKLRREIGMCSKHEVCNSD